jgi:hypothetical protein
MDASTLQTSLYEISIMRLPLPSHPLSEAAPEGHSITPRHANTEAEALAECGILVKKVTGSKSRGQTFIGIMGKSCGGSILEQWSRPLCNGYRTPALSTFAHTPPRRRARP